MSCGQGSLQVYHENGTTLSLSYSIPTRSGARTSLFVPSLGRFFVAMPSSGSVSAAVASFALTTPSASTTSRTSSPNSAAGTMVMSVTQPVIVSPGLSQTFTLSLEPIGNLSGTFQLSAPDPPSSVSVTFFPSTVTLPGQVANPVVFFTMVASKGATPVNATFTIKVGSGSTTFKSSQSLRIVPYLVIIQGDTFTPAALTIKAGSTVVWVNWDILGGQTGVEPADLVSNGLHSVVADDGSFSSPTLSAGAPVYSYTFLTAGQFSYHDGEAPSIMHSTIIVTSG
jgi:plastocyanin